MSLSMLPLVTRVTTTKKSSHLNIHSILFFSFFFLHYNTLFLAARGIATRMLYYYYCCWFCCYMEIFVAQNAVSLNFRILIKSHIFSHNTLCVEIREHFLQVLLENIVINARYLQSSTRNLQGVFTTWFQRLFKHTKPSLRLKFYENLFKFFTSMSTSLIQCCCVCRTFFYLTKTVCLFPREMVTIRLKLGKSQNTEMKWERLKIHFIPWLFVSLNFTL